MNKNKAIQIVAEHKDARIIPKPESFDQIGQGIGLICVVDNGLFEAAAFCFDEQEFKEFIDPKDPRPKTWVVMDRDKAEILSKYRK